MMIFQQVEIGLFCQRYFRSIATRTVWLLHKYKAHTVADTGLNLIGAKTVNGHGVLGTSGRGSGGS